MAAITSDFPVHGGDDDAYAVALDAQGSVTVTFSTTAGTAWLVPALPAFTWGVMGDMRSVPLGEANLLMSAVARVPVDYGTADAPNLSADDLDPATLSAGWASMVTSLTEEETKELKKPVLPEVFLRKLRRIVASKPDAITSAFVLTTANFKPVPARRQNAVTHTSTR